MRFRRRGYRPSRPRFRGRSRYTSRRTRRPIMRRRRRYLPIGHRM